MMLKKLFVPHVKCRTEYLNLFNEGAEYSVNINRVTGVEQERQVPDQSLPINVTTEERSCQPATEPQDTNNKQYAVERIVRHVTATKGPRNVLRWNGYSSEYGTVEPLEHSSNYFWNAHWRRKKARSATTKWSRNDGTRCKQKSPKMSKNRRRSTKIAERST